MAVELTDDEVFGAQEMSDDDVFGAPSRPTSISFPLEDDTRQRETLRSFLSANQPESPLRSESQLRLGPDRRVTGIAGDEVTPINPAAVRDDLVSTAAQGGIGLQTGFNALGETGWTGVQAASEPIVEFGPLALTPTGLRYAPLARKAAEDARQIALEARERNRPLEELSSEIGGDPFAKTLASGAVQLAPALAAGPLGLGATIATSGAQAGLGTLSDAQEFFEQIPEERRKNWMPNPEFWSATAPAALDALQTAAITFVSGKLFGSGLEGVSAPIKRDAIRNTIGSRVKEAAGEAIEEGAQQFISDYVIARMVHRPDLTFEEAFANAIDAAKAGGILGGAASVARGASESAVAQRREQQRQAEIENAIQREAIEREAIKGGRPDRRLGVSTLPLETPEVSGFRGVEELINRSLQEAQSPIEVPGRVPAIELLRNELQPPRIEAVEPTRVAERIEGGGEAPFGKVSFQRTAEAPTAPRTQAARASEALSVSAPAGPTAESIVGMAPEQYFETSQQWARDSMAGRGEPVQIQAELAALRDPVVSKWKEGYAKAAQEAAAIKAEVQANPASMGDPAVQKRFGGAAQKAQFFQEGLKVLEGTEPNARTKAALEREQALRTTEPRTTEIAEPIPLKDTAAEVSKFEAEFPGAPKINIAPDFTAMPKTAQDLAFSVGSDPRLIEAYVRNGEVWINAEAVTSPAMVKRLALHETGGHWAVDKKLGKSLQRFMEQAHDTWADSETMAAVRERYPNADKITLGRELVARLSEDPMLAPNLWKRVVAQFRQWLRDAGFVKTVSENDIQALITGAIDGMRKVERGEATGDGMLSLKSAAEKANERFPAESPRTEAAAPPVIPPATPPVIPAAAGKPAPKAGLDDIYRIFEPEKKTGTSLKERGIRIAEAFRTGVSSKFRPINKLAEDIATSYGLSKPKDIAGIMEQLKGSQGRGEADIYRFDRDVSKLVEGQEKDFNAYIFIRRAIDRLQQDAADIDRAMAGENVPKLNRRAVGGYTLEQLQPKLAALEAKLGTDGVAKFEQAANQYQNYMDAALRLQVESGRMAPEVYQVIKDGNQFYAPFKVMKYIEESSKPEGSGKKIDTVADFTKAMKGIEDADFRLGDMLGAARQSILMSRILADKNNAMRHVSELAAFDVEGKFIKRLAPDAEAPKGFEAVNVLEGGKKVQYAVRPEVAEAIQLYGGNAGGVISKWLGYASIPFRAGATALNIPFQVSNLLADQPRAALISKYGLRGVNDLIQYPLDFGHALYSSIAGDVFGKKNKLFLDFLDSGVAGTTVQEFLTPDALKFKEPSGISKSRKLASTVINTIPRFAQAIEQTSKVLGVKRAMRFEGVESGAQLAKQVPEAITELRRFSGSPDFGRQGKTVEQLRLNLLYMFLNARIQGTIADVGRLAGRDGKAAAAQTWLKIGPAVGIPTALLYFLNNREDYKEDYEKRPEQEKRNYWLIPKDSYITNDDGEKMRDYWRIPKREVSKWFANFTESALDFAKKRDLKAATEFGASMIEELFPVNIQGDTAQERLESVGASLNPLIKAPLELGSGRDLYRHRPIVPEKMREASPEQQFTPRTAEAFKKLANVMPDVMPEALRSPLLLENMTRNLTAGLITQFIPRKPVEGRSRLENNPLLARFQALPYTDSTEFQSQMDALKRVAADEQLERHRQATKLIDDNKGLPLDKILGKTPLDERLFELVIDLYVARENGITAKERQLLALPVRQRAAYIANQLEGLTPEKKQELLLDFSRKRILTEAVFQEMSELMP